ncbi:hypothetical protein HZB60_02235 [candidate division KSB1 bacterium]|nr:hypothetical protein [candidate division KSB1 bacterium]
MTRYALILVPCSLFLVLAASAQQLYDPGDWVSYQDFRYARALDAGQHELFVATSGGILNYDLLKRQWYDPMVVGYSLSGPVRIDDPMLLYFDDPAQRLWVATRTQLLQYDLGMESWKLTDHDRWTEQELVVNLGVGGEDLYVETIPASLYTRLFHPNSPIPDPIWYDAVTRYKGSRQFGGLMIDISGADPGNVRWRGLRSKIPLERNDLLNPQPLPPVGFPVALMPSGYTWQADGTVIDQQLRPAPITDWIMDRWGTLWTAQWGAGIMQTDLRLGSATFYQAGPAGNDVRTIHIGPEKIWMGGLNSGEREGFARVNDYFDEWTTVERRADSRIRSTDVWDITDWGGKVWFATNEGLLSYHEKRGTWERLDVTDNLYASEIRALARGGNSLWVGTVRGLCELGAGGEIWRVQNPGIELAGVTDLLLFNDDLFVATPQGLFKGSASNREFSYVDLEGGLLNAPVVDLCLDGDSVWLATPDGIEVMNTDGGYLKSWLSNTWFNSSRVSSILATDRHVWVGTDGSGMYRYRKDTGEWISYTTADGLIDNHVQVLRLFGDDLLIGTPNGLTRFYWNRAGRLR